MLAIVPTLGTRNNFLREAIASIRCQDVAADIIIVTTSSAGEMEEIAGDFGARVVCDSGNLPSAINLGMSLGTSTHEFVTWLNDDDGLELGAFAAATQLLDANPQVVAAFGFCRYVDEVGRELWVSRAGRWAPRILSWGPDLIPQPGMLIRSSAWQTLGGLDQSYRLAFDLDLLLRLKRIGTLASTETVVSYFRWHAGSLTVNARETNLSESERARRASLGPRSQRWCWMWERPMRVAVRIGVWVVSRRANGLVAG